MYTQHGCVLQNAVDAFGEVYIELYALMGSCGPTDVHQQQLSAGNWLVTGGEPEDMEISPALYAFDFATLQWSKATVTGASLQFRASFAATCHCGAFVAMGGNVLPCLCLNACFHMLLQGLMSLHLAGSFRACIAQQPSKRMHVSSHNICKACLHAL